MAAGGEHYGTLRTLPPPKRAGEEKLLMARLFYEDSSHDLLKPNKSFDEWGDKYKLCLENLFPGMHQYITNRNVGQSDNGFFKREVTRRCELVVEAAAAALAAALAATTAGAATVIVAG